MCILHFSSTKSNLLNVRKCVDVEMKARQKGGDGYGKLKDT